jgi:hypothetical protein
LRLRSPAKIASIVIVACALCLLGGALAVGGTLETQPSRLGGVAIDQHSLLVPHHSAGVLGRQAPDRNRGHRIHAAPPLSRARPARGAIALRRGKPRGGGQGSPRHVAAALTPSPAGPTGNGSALSLPPAPVSPPTPIPSPDGSPPALYWGASIGSQLTGVQAPWDMHAVTEFEQIAGKQVSLVNFFSPFANCPASGGACSFYKFPTGPMESIRAYGAIPVFSWSSQSIPSTKEEPNFQLSDVIAGTYDSYIREFAEAAKAWDHPFFMRFDWEMNGSWFPWSEGVNGNQPGEFVAAWRHVHDIFAAVGADNVTWVWCPNVDPDNLFLNLASQYPGDEYVDWTGLDGYNWGLNPAKPDRWRNFNELYSATYQRIVDTIAPEKPMLIGEMGSTEQGGSKAQWIEEALTAIPTYYSQIRGMLWFDTYDDGMDWPIETSASSANAFAAAIQSPAYVSEGDPAVAEGPIEPPQLPVEAAQELIEPAS